LKRRNPHHFSRRNFFPICNSFTLNLHNFWLFLNKIWKAKLKLFIESCTNYFLAKVKRHLPTCFRQNFSALEKKPKEIVDHIKDSIRLQFLSRVFFFSSKKSIIF
jgi:hypothetical protein